MQAICQWGARVPTELALGGREFRDSEIWGCMIMEVKIRKKNQLTSILQFLNPSIP